MNKFDLDAKLKAVPLPERAEEYWENFPVQLRWQLRRAAPPAENWLPQFAWKFGAGFACFAVALLVFSQPLSAASAAIAKKEKFVRQQLVAIPRHLQVFMADEHGLHHLIAEKE